MLPNLWKVRHSALGSLGGPKLGFSPYAGPPPGTPAARKVGYDWDAGLGCRALFGTAAWRVAAAICSSIGAHAASKHMLGLVFPRQAETVLTGWGGADNDVRRAEPRGSGVAIPRLGMPGGVAIGQVVRLHPSGPGTSGG